MKRVKKVSDAFKEQPTREYVNDYLAELRTNWRESERSFTRTALLLLALCAFAELLARGRIKDVSTDFFTIEDVGLVRKALPIAIAYLYAKLGSYWAEVSMFEEAHRRVLDYIYPQISDANFERPLMPTSSSLLTSDRFFYAMPERSVFRPMLNFAGASRAIAFITAPPVFLLYYFRVLIRDYGLDDVFFG